MAVVALAGCTRETREVPEGTVSREEAADVARDAGRPVYWAGASYDGLPLTSATAGRPGEIHFGYGTCELPAGTDGGCAVPVQIQNFPFRANDWRRASGCRALRPVGGVPAFRHDGFVLFTRDGVVKIYARSRADERRVARRLARVGSDEPARLAPPRANVLALVERVCD